MRYERKIKMKKLTEQEVFNQLVNNSSAECEGLGEGTVVRYYLHVTEDGVIVDDYQKADATFVTDIHYWRYADTVEEFKTMENLFNPKYETMSWKPFADVVKELTSEANNWLASIEA